jgi:hypothetical protein
MDGLALNDEGVVEIINIKFFIFNIRFLNGHIGGRKGGGL